jgi:hypothetical protein
MTASTTISAVTITALRKSTGVLSFNKQKTGANYDRAGNNRILRCESEYDALGIVASDWLEY